MLCGVIVSQDMDNAGSVPSPLFLLRLFPKHHYSYGARVGLARIRDDSSPNGIIILAL